MESIPFAPSRNIQDIQYDLDTQTLIIDFNSGYRYRYAGVTGEEAQGFAQNLSAGDYLRQFIMPLHDGVRIDKPDETEQP
jgi:hypothetical protein